ncbi:hypothetical protein FNV43_RR11036 [Rhamnella rubrinervis]|uniref:Uncharacterized protein n=1 Tax=Rhamnella rubrinervis TaxID=2594499 RepID=A0A8K0H5D1_9ROSA|nr:hypothetical protein FNV43_RR11036 [Rhamnella rubrinervis]
MSVPFYDDNFYLLQMKNDLEAKSVGSSPTLDLAPGPPGLRADVLHNPILSGLRIRIFTKFFLLIVLFSSFIFDVNSPLLLVLWQAASICQHELLSHLGSMDPLNNTKMSLAIDHYFPAWNHLSADCNDRVRKLIACASSFTEIERSINADSSAKEIMERYEEKNRYNNIYHIHAHKVDAVIVSEQPIKSLRKKALHKINAAYEEVEAAKKLGEEREVARKGAKAALEEATIQLLK